MRLGTASCKGRGEIKWSALGKKVVSSEWGGDWGENKTQSQMDLDIKRR